MELDQALAFLKAVKELGVSTISVNGLEASFTTTPPLPRTLAQDTSVIKTLVIPLSAGTLDTSEANAKELARTPEVPTDEELMYYSTPYYDELMAKKEAQYAADTDK